MLCDLLFSGDATEGLELSQLALFFYTGAPLFDDASAATSQSGDNRQQAIVFCWSSANMQIVRSFTSAVPVSGSAYSSSRVAAVQRQAQVRRGLNVWFLPDSLDGSLLRRRSALRPSRRNEFDAALQNECPFWGGPFYRCAWFECPQWRRFSDAGHGAREAPRRAEDPHWKTSQGRSREVFLFCGLGPC